MATLWQSNCNTYIFYCLIAIFRGKFTRQWNILSNILWCYLYNYFLVEHFRSPSCMAISRSYPRHLVKFPEKKSILSSSRSSPYYLPGHLPIYAPNYQPGYPSGYLMLPNLTNQFIKLSDGDLQCEWNSDIVMVGSRYLKRSVN